MQTTMIVATVAIAIFTAAVAIMSVLMFFIYKRIEWFTGAMESHSSLMLRIEAQREGIQMRWWDPTEELPSKTGPHNTECKIDMLAIGMHPRDRKNPPRYLVRKRDKGEAKRS